MLHRGKQQQGKNWRMTQQRCWGAQQGCCLCHPAASAVDGTEMSDSIRLSKSHLSYLPQEKTKARTDSF